MARSDWTETVANAGLSIAADTVGVLWSAASGTVDPFTKAQQVYEEANPAGNWHPSRNHLGLFERGRGCIAATAWPPDPGKTGQSGR